MPQPGFRRLIQKIAFSHSSEAHVFSDFCRMVACSLAMQTREDEYLEVIRPYSQAHFRDLSEAMALLILEMESHPFSDRLGESYLEIAAHSSKQTRGEFYTPQAISRLMARVSIDADAIIATNEPIRILEPACGAGAMVLAIAERFAPGHVDLLRVTCQDINPVATDITLINTSLWGIPAEVILGNALDRTTRSHKVWKNCHWHRVGEDGRQQSLSLRQNLRAREDPDPAERASKRAPLSQSKKGQVNQSEFDFDLGLVRDQERSR